MNGNLPEKKKKEILIKIKLIQRNFKDILMPAS
jgi:hypothetical protein